MKKTGFFMIVMILAAVMLPAQDIFWGSMYDDGNLRLGADAAYETAGTDRQIALYPEAEVLLWKPVIGNFAFLDIGGVVKGRIGLPVSVSAGLSAGAGLLGTMHLGFRGFDFTGSEYLSKADFFAEAGIKFDFINAGNSTFGMAWSSGVNYFLTEKLAVGAFYSDWGEFSGGGLSISLKLGKTPEVAGFNLDFPGMAPGLSVNPYLLQFYTLYYSAHYAGGFYPDSYKEGQETVYRVSVMDSAGTESYKVRKSMLGNLSGGLSLWGLEYDDGEDSFYYEYTIDEDGYVQTVYYNGDDGIIKLDATVALDHEAEYLTWDDYGAEKSTGIEIKVEAGVFKSDEYYYTDGSGVIINWWASKEVPGRLISYKMEDHSDIVTSELIAINQNKKPLLHK